ncbi:hypothetical protein HW555_004107 [Spodoptera exigua]|uniref:BTB domain-containing protein n=1 Tax=Spodoptera exigua TaxID=7107 RepID=A0A835GJT6_SPOEX|nr:hypothetical protein HW555_004107 [Spodoptera exigua]
MDDSNPEISLLIDDQVFKAKRDDLIQHSDFFRAMFTGDYVERERKQIFIEVVDAASMSIIMRYMNIGLIDLSEFDLPTIGDLAVAASFLQITELTKQIDYCLEQQLTLANWLEVKEIASNAALVKLEQSTVIYGLFSFHIMKTEYIQSLDKLYWYLAHPYLNIESEIQVFKFGLKWLQEHEMGADTLLVVLCCLDLKRITYAEVREIRDLIKDYTNSLAEKVVDCLYKLVSEYDLSLDTIRQNKTELCQEFTEKVYTEVFNLVKESIERKLRFIPTVPMWSNKDKKPEVSQNYLFTYTEEAGFQRWMEVAERNLWGWNITAWSPTQIVVVCGEYGRGSGIFMRDVKVYDIYKKEWTQHGVELPLRRHAGVVVVNDSLFLLGGVGGFRLHLKYLICSGHHSNLKNVTSAQKQCKHTHGSFYCSSSMATPAVGTINEMKLPCTAMILDRMFSTSWLAAKKIMNIRARCFCSKSDTTEVHSASAQGIDMNLAKPKRKEAADPLEIPEPARPEDPLPGIPVPGFPDVTIPFAPDLPIPDLPEVPVPVKPGELPNKTLPGKPSPIIDNILPKWRAPVLPDLSTLFTSPIVLHKAVENYKSEYLMLSSQIEIISKANNYFFKKCGLSESSIIQPIDQKIILKLNENDAFSNNENVNKLILAILELVVLDSAVVYNLKERSFRPIAKLPDAVQSPAVCAHNNEVYVIGHRNIYKYEEVGDRDRWTKVLGMEMTPSYLVSFKGYIYVAQCYFPNLYRFRPGVDEALQQIACFCHPPKAICNLGYRLIAVTCSGDTSTDILSVEELHIVGDGKYYQNTKVLWSQTGSVFGVNPSGSCSVVMTMPEINPTVSAYHQRYIVMYG